MLIKTSWIISLKSSGGVPLLCPSCNVHGCRKIQNTKIKNTRSKTRVLVHNLETGNRSLNQKSKHILEKLNLPTFSSSHPLLYHSLLQRLENIDNPSTEDCRLILKIHRKSIETRKPISVHTVVK